VSQLPFWFYITIAFRLNLLQLRF